METAEEFLERLVRDGFWAMHTSVELTDGDVALRLIEADRAAVALSVLDELAAAGESALSNKHWGELIDDAIEDLREKYAAKAGAPGAPPEPVVGSGS